MLEREISIAQLIRNFIKGAYEIDLGSLLNRFFYGGTASAETNFCGYPRGNPKPMLAEAVNAADVAIRAFISWELKVSEGT